MILLWTPNYFSLIISLTFFKKKQCIYTFHISPNNSYNWGLMIQFLKLYFNVVGYKSKP